jgi:hypothetical protein
MSSLAEELPREMARVRDDVIPAFESLRRMTNVIVEPQIAMMKADLDRATKALAEGDVVEMLRVYQSLKETRL